MQNAIVQMQIPGERPPIQNPHNLSMPPKLGECAFDINLLVVDGAGRNRRIRVHFTAAPDPATAVQYLNIPCAHSNAFPRKRRKPYHLSGPTSAAPE
jgi:hypothetical protein